MKNKILIGLVFVCCNSFHIYGQQITKPYDFPIKPGTTEWSGLVTESERFDAMQIPDDILSGLTTLALVKTCLNFPAFGYITAYENSQTGFIILATKFNGLRELAKRQNAAIHLISIYKETGETGFVSPNLHLDEKYWTIKFNWIELLLAQNKMLSSISNEDKKNLLIICQDKFKMKRLSEDFSLHSLKSTAFLMARTLHSIVDDQFVAEYSKNKALQTFVKTSELKDIQLIYKVLELTNDYIKQ